MRLIVPGPEFFSRLGLFVVNRFLSAEECGRLVDEIASGPAEPGRVYASAGETLDLQLKHNWSVAMPGSTEGWVTQKLLAIKSRVATRFDLELSGCQPPVFKLYRPGNFHGVHTDDGGRIGSVPREIQARKITAVVFLNGESREHAAGAYTGGALTLYGLGEAEPWRSLGFPLNGETGLLVAFPASLPHEVLPVTSGERCTIVSWYY